MYLLASLILQNFFKKILELIQSYEDKHHFRDQNGPFVLNENFQVQTIVITFIYLLVLFIVQNLKNSYSGSRIMTMHHFWAQTSQFAPNFFLKNYYYHSHLRISPFHCAKFLKNSSSRSRVVRMCNFWSQNGPFPRMRIFSENLLMSLVPSIHAYYMPKIKVRC